MHFLTVPEDRNQRLRCWQIWFLLRALKEGSVPGLSPWRVDGCHLPLSSHRLPSVYLYVQISSSYKDTSHIGLGPTLKNSFWLNYLFKNLISKYGYILRYWGLKFHIWILRRYNSSYETLPSGHPTPIHVLLVCKIHSPRPNSPEVLTHSNISSKSKIPYMCVYIYIYRYIDI